MKRNFERGSKVMKPAYCRQDVKDKFNKNMQHILRVIIHYSSWNTGTTQVDKGQTEEDINTTYMHNQQ
jgi:hypothetical protein